MISKFVSLARLVVRNLRTKEDNSTTKNGRYGYHGRFQSWQEASEGVPGYADPEIAARVALAAQKVLTGEAAYERDSVNFERIEYAFPIVAGLLWCAAVSGKLHVLDFGGGLGTIYLQTKHLLSSVQDLKWTIVEQPQFVQHGKPLFKNEATIQFFDSIDEGCQASKPNVVIVSSSLQYVPEPHQLISKIVASQADVIILDRTIVSGSDKDEVTRQHVDPKIFAAIIPTWILSEKLLLASFAEDYHLLARFPATTFTQSLDLEGRTFSELGFIFVRRGSKFDPDIAIDRFQTP